MTEQASTESRAEDTGYQPVDWNVPVIYQYDEKAVDNSTFEPAEESLQAAVGDVVSSIPDKLQRDEPPALPTLTEPEISRHYTRLSQQTLGVDTASMIGLGTCTMKYNPKFSERLAARPGAAEIHPDQPAETVQGTLELLYRLQEYLAEIAGMDAFSLHPRGGAHAVFTNACIIREYHRDKGQLDEKDEIISTVLAHPCNAGAPAMAGFDVVSLYPDEDTGLLEMDAVEEAVSDRTAGMLVTNPYDTGMYDPQMKEFIERIHDVDGLVAIDQANLNGLLGKLRIGDVGADLCHFNLHKTFGAPHGSYGPAAAPIGAKEHLVDYLPTPAVEYDGERYYLEEDRPKSVGKTAGFYGTVPALLKAYAWIRCMGPAGLENTAEVAVINNNYLIEQLLNIQGVDIAYGRSHRLQESRLTFQGVKEDTGVGTEDINHRTTDYGIQHYFPGHHPYTIPEPCTPEPTEAVSRDELDTWAGVIEQIVDEAYEDPDLVKEAPHKAPIGHIDDSRMLDPSRTALTWSAFEKKRD